MALQEINIGTTANDGTGDQLRAAFDKANQNFAEVYSGGTTVAAPVTLNGVSGDTAGMIATDGTSFYVCFATWTDGVSPIWLKTDAASLLHAADATLHFTQAAISITESQVSDLQNYVLAANAPALPHGIAGDEAGMIASDASWIYVCTANYVDNATAIWTRIALPAPASAIAW